jgi:sporulation protein YlmC with PRC-barrel domain
VSGAAGLGGLARRRPAPNKPLAQNLRRQLANRKEDEMATNMDLTTIVKLGDTELTVADPAEDVRGRTVLDATGEEIGDVSAIMIDDLDKKVRFLQVGSGGMLGIGEKKFLIPVDAVTRVDDDHVHVDRSRQHVHGGPTYDPSMVRKEDYADVYGYYGYAPYWTAGYAYPPYPYYRLP